MRMGICVIDHRACAESAELYYNAFYLTVDLFVVGVGVYSEYGEVGYRGIKTSEYYYYLLGLAEKPWMVSKLLEEGVPRLPAGRGNIAVCKLIAQCNSPKSINERVLRYYKKNLSDYFSQTERDAIERNGYEKVESIIQYYADNGLYKTLKIIPFIEQDKIDIEDLYQFLVKAEKDNPGLLDNSELAIFERSQYKKCINIWDWLKYHDRAEKKLKEFAIS